MATQEFWENFFDSSDIDFLNCIGSTSLSTKEHVETGSPGFWNDNHQGPGEAPAISTTSVPQDEFALGCHNWQLEQQKAGEVLFPSGLCDLWPTPSHKAMEEYPCTLLPAQECASSPLEGFQGFAGFESPVGGFQGFAEVERLKDKQQGFGQAVEAVATLSQQRELALAFHYSQGSIPYQPGAFQPDMGTQDFGVTPGSCLGLGGGYPMDQNGIQLGNLVEDPRFAVRPENVMEENDEWFDIQEEKNHIFERMLGEKPSIDPSLKEHLKCVVGVYQSLQTREPRHCQQECLEANDPAECCWNVKLAEVGPSLKKSFQREITLSLNRYLTINEKRVLMLPLHCTEALSAWTHANYSKPYMPETIAVKMAKELGVTKNQINHWLDNWRTRTWDPIPEGQRRRKGTKFPHLKEDSTNIKIWVLREERCPSKEEANILSIGSSMTPKQILDHSHNFRKRNKNLFKNWKGSPSTP